MDEIIQRALEGNPKIAIIGASNDAEKYGFRIYENLKLKGFEIYPINNKRAEIQGDKSYPDISSLPTKVDILDFVVPPPIAFEISKNAYDLGYRTFWFQPGSESFEAIEYWKEKKDVNLIYRKCIMVETD